MRKATCHVNVRLEEDSAVVVPEALVGVADLADAVVEAAVSKLYLSLKTGIFVIVNNLLLNYYRINQIINVPMNLL